ncbi:putative transcription factor interactor and regulator CCHC(Zn) family [Helianthus debilis subsp. tardiflorus]
MKEHLRMLEESDSDDGKARKKKKKVKKQVCSDDEEVQVIKRKDFPTVEGMKAFEEEEASEEKNSEKKKDTEIKISGTSTDEEEKTNFWRESNSEFLAKKQDEQKRDTRTCYRCNNVGHIAKDYSQAIQSKQGVFRKISEKEFDAEKVFNSEVKNIFGKMIDRKVNGVKEFYEKKTKKEKVEPSLVCDWDGTYYEQ